MTSLVGARMGCFNAVTLVRRTGKALASQARNMQRDETNANWIRVSVAGLSNALRMDLDEVLVSADEVYHNRQRICQKHDVSKDKKYAAEGSAMPPTGQVRAAG